MRTGRRIGAAVALSALVLGSVPAEAGGRHRHRDDRAKVGDFLIAAGLLGIVAAVVAEPVAAEPVAPPSQPGDNPAVDPAEADAVDRCLTIVAEHYADDDRLARSEEIGAVEPTEKGFKVRGRVRVAEGSGDGRLAAFRCSVSRSGRSHTLTIG